MWTRDVAMKMEVEVDRPWLFSWPWEAKVALALGSRGLRHPYPWSPRVVALCLLLAEGVGGLATKSTTVAVAVDVTVEVEVEMDRPWL